MERLLKNMKSSSALLFLIIISCHSYDKSIPLEKESIETESISISIKDTIEALFKDSLKIDNIVLVDTAFLEVVEVLSAIPVLMENKIVFSRLIKVDSLFILPIEGAEGYCSIFLELNSGKLSHIGGSQQHVYIYSPKYKCLLSFSKFHLSEEEEYANCIYTFLDKKRIYKDDTIKTSDKVYSLGSEMNSVEIAFFDNLFDSIALKQGFRPPN